jgi:leucyl-tRNA synthetase
MGEPGKELHRKTHETIERVNADLDRFQMNTAIAALMELTNTLSLTLQDEGFRPAPDAADGAALREAVDSLLVLLAPMAPFLTEELWEDTGHEGTIFHAAIPRHDPAALVRETFTLVVQVGGKLRARLEAPVGATEEAAVALALGDPNVAGHLGGKSPRKTIYVPGKLLNLVP